MNPTQLHNTPRSCRRGALWTIGLLSLAVAGCAKPGDPNLITASGRVTLNGRPVEGALVVFSTRVLDAKPANAVTDKDGRYEIQTYQGGSTQYDGAYKGKYYVAISKIRPTKKAREFSPDPEVIQAMSQAEKRELARKMQVKMTPGGGKDKMAKLKSRKGPPSPKEAEKEYGQMSKDFVKNELPARYADSNTSGLKIKVVKGSQNVFDFDLKDG